MLRSLIATILLATPAIAQELARALSRPEHVPVCAPFDFEEWRREHPRPAGKQIASLDVGDSRTVRTIYFIPKDRNSRTSTVHILKERIRQAQRFFIEQMKVHGYDSAILRIEEDSNGKPLILQVRGEHRTRYYNEKNTVSRVLKEVEKSFDIEKNIYFIAIDNENDFINRGDQIVGGVGGRWGKSGGFAMTAVDGELETIFHELGHACGLAHDFRSNAYVMSYGGPTEERPIDENKYGQSKISACNAKMLTVHPYFNDDISIKNNEWPALRAISSSPIQTAGKRNISIQVRSQSENGLYQAILFTVTNPPHLASGSLEVKDCYGLGGEKNRVIDFDYDGAVPSLPTSDFYSFERQELIIGVVDVLGEWNYSEVFELVNKQYREPIALLSSSSSKTVRFFVGLFFSGTKLFALEASWDKEDRKVKLWDVKANKATTLPQWGPITAFTSTAFNGQLLALESDDYEIKLWNVKKKKPAVSIENPHARDEKFEGPIISAMAFSPDGSVLATAGRDDALVKLWDVASGKLISTFSRRAVSSLTFSPDGKKLATYGYWGMVLLYDLENKTKIEWNAHDKHFSGGRNEIVFSLDGKRLATGGQEGEIEDEAELKTEVKLWNVADGKLIKTLPASPPLAFSPKSRLLVSATQQSTRYFDLEGLGQRHLGWNFGGNSTQLWDGSTGNPIKLLSPWDTIRALAFSSNGLMLAEHMLTSVRLWDVSEWAEAKSVTDNTTSSATDNTTTSDSTSVSNPEPSPESDLSLFLVTVEDITSARERGRMTFTVRIEPTPTAPITVKYATSSRTAKAGEDYQAATGMLEFEAGQDTATFRVRILPDQVDEEDEFFKVRITNPATKELLAEATGTIMDDDEDTLAQLLPNTPNPFNSQTVLSYYLSRHRQVRLEVFTLSGQRIAVLDQGIREPGYHRIYWDSRNDAGHQIASGIYLYRLTTDNEVLTRKLMLLR